MSIMKLCENTDSINVRKLHHLCKLHGANDVTQQVSISYHPLSYSC